MYLRGMNLSSAVRCGNLRDVNVTNSGCNSSFRKWSGGLSLMCLQYWVSYDTLHFAGWRWPYLEPLWLISSTRSTSYQVAWGLAMKALLSSRLILQDEEATMYMYKIAAESEAVPCWLSQLLVIREVLRESWHNTLEASGISFHLILLPVKLEVASHLPGCVCCCFWLSSCSVWMETEISQRPWITWAFSLSCIKCQHNSEWHQRGVALDLMCRVPGLCAGTFLMWYWITLG